MILRPTNLRPTLFHVPRPSTAPTIRCLHARIAPPPVPEPTPFIPNPQTFLTVIGRNLSAHAAKIPSWPALFTLTSPQLRELGIEPARARRYLLRMRDRFRRGWYGVGGDAKYVSDDGAAELRVVEKPLPKERLGGRAAMATATRGPGVVKVVVNVPAGEAAPPEGVARATPVQGVKVVGAWGIAGPHVEPVKGREGVARIRVKEGLWEERRGRKVDGGERRKAEVRAKRRAAERKS